ncbi:MAG TPA: coenzyme F420-0:L-glutamate ligase [Candidatus Acidoferrales bacterium]|nr:coenzyme F420-0:L-glutamate ligase [Candidatus Acidoferrales bacterium]
MPGTKKPRGPSAVRIVALHGIPEVQRGDNLSALVAEAARKQRMPWEAGDILVLAQKVVSKAEGATVDLTQVLPSAKAQELAAKLGKDPRFFEVVLQQSRRILRTDRVLITETHHGFICANAGVDHSNVPGRELVSVLPKDPDGTARVIARGLKKLTGKRVAVIISDTFGRPWRLGLTNVAIGASGLQVLRDLRGTRDRGGKLLQATVLAVADELAAAAGLVMGKAAGIPAVILRGYRYTRGDEPATKILRPADEDLFR